MYWYQSISLLCTERSEAERNQSVAKLKKGECVIFGKKLVKFMIYVANAHVFVPNSKIQSGGWTF